MVASCSSSNDFKVFFQSNSIDFSLTSAAGLVSVWVLGAGAGVGFLGATGSTGFTGADGAFSLLFILSIGTIGLLKI